MPRKQDPHTVVRPVANSASPIEPAARMIGFRAEELLGWRKMEDGSLVMISPDGRKHRFSREELEHLNRTNME